MDLKGGPWCYVAEDANCGDVKVSKWWYDVSLKRAREEGKLSRAERVPFALISFAAPYNLYGVK